MIYYILCEFHRVYKNVKRSTVEIPVLPLYVCCVLRQGTLCIFVLVHIDRIGYRLRLEVNQRGLVSHPEGVYDFYPIIPRKPGILKLLLLVGELKKLQIRPKRLLSSLQNIKCYVKT